MIKNDKVTVVLQREEKILCIRSKNYSVEAGWILISLLCCRFDCIDKGQVADNFADGSVVSYLR
jgi:hypothetical protein